MPSFSIATPGASYEAVVERGVLAKVRDFIPAKAGKVFVVSTRDVWRHQGERFQARFAGLPHEVLFLPGGESNKRIAPLEQLAEQMVGLGADRSSLVIAFGGGIVNDMAGFLAAIFMRGIPVLQIPTTLLAQVDAAVGGKTGVNLVAGKNLVGSFHQPLAVLIDPSVLKTLPEREYRAGLYEVIKHGVIRSPRLFEVLDKQRDKVLVQSPDVVDEIVSESVRIKAEVVTADEREGGLRKILNFGHTFGHALEAETRYERFLHGESVGFGMIAATHLARSIELLKPAEADAIVELVNRYGPIPSLAGIEINNIFRRLVSDKKTVQGRVHFVLPTRIGEVKVVSDVKPELVREAIDAALHGEVLCESGAVPAQ